MSAEPESTAGTIVRLDRGTRETTQSYRCVTSIPKSVIAKEAQASGLGPTQQLLKVGRPGNEGGDAKKRGN